MLAVGLFAYPVSASEVPSLGLYGSDDVLWIFLRKPDKTGTLHLYFSFWLQRDIQRGGHFRPHIQGLSGGIAKAALRGTDLHAIYRDGTHWRYQAQAFSRLPTAKPLRVAERNIPGNVVPAALGFDRGRSVLYALITARQAHEMIKLEQEATALREEAVHDDDPIEKTQRAIVTPLQEITTDYAIIYYEEGRWRVDRNAPSDLTLGSEVQTIVGDGDAIHLLYEDGAIPNTYLYKQSASASASWSSSSPISFDAPLESAILSLSDQSPLMVVSLGHNNSIDVSIYRFQDDSWRLSNVLSDSEGHVRHFTRPVAVSLFADTIAVARQDADHVVSVGRWSLETGLPVEPAKTVIALQHYMLTTPESRVRTLIQYGILGGILTVVFLRRRESVTVVASIKDDQQLAPFTRRLASFLVDMSILFPLWGALLFRQIMAMDGAMSAFEPMGGGESISPNHLQFWLMAIIGAIFGTYCLIFESIGAATPGKRLLGLTVVSDQGQRCSFAAIVIRNLVRPMEFYFPPVALLVIVTPSRQRLGDMLARSVVVMPLPPTKGRANGQEYDSNENEPHIDEQV